MQNKFDKDRTRFITTYEQREQMLHECYELIMNDTRFVLDNLDHLPTFQANARNVKRKEKDL